MAGMHIFHSIIICSFIYCRAHHGACICSPGIHSSSWIDWGTEEKQRNFGCLSPHIFSKDK